MPSGRGVRQKFITKPWDPSELKSVVQQAAANYDLLKQRAEELTRAHAQTMLLNTILQVTRQATDLESLLTSIAAAFGQTYAAYGGDALRELGRSPRSDG